MPASFSAGFVVLGRTLTAALGCAAMVWGAVTLPSFWRQATLDGIARKIIAGETFKPEALAAFLPNMEATEATVFCRASALRSSAIIRMHIAEQGLAADSQKASVQMDAAKQTVREALSCSPADSFLWLGLFWVEGTRRPHTTQDLQYLRLSYQLGRNEGWIALKRSRAAFAIFQQLPPDLAEYVLIEFAGLIESKFYEQAAEIFTGPAWSVHGEILQRLNRLAEPNRQSLSDALRQRGFDVEIPGILRRDLYPKN